MMNLSAITLKMVDFYKGNREDIRHFIKVHAFARTIGMAERLYKRTQDTLEVAAIVHDIACPICREKYGDTNGDHQEAESEALLCPFLEEFNLPKEMEERVIFIVTHHHTYVNVEGRDWQILLEADYLVNADESEKYMKGFDGFREKVFKTATGKRLLASMYPEKMK